jgi:LmbE family N-acetylglucosaminyl deacetylase
MDETPQRVLVVTPHPDDAEFWCAGTIARWVGQGATVRYVLCTDGGKGTNDPDVTAEELGAVREQEQLDAARVLGVSDVVMLHHPDGELEDTTDFRKEIVRQIRLLRPDVVICPEPYRRNLAWHRDHRITGQVTLDAVFPAARDHLNFVELWRDEGLEPHKTAMVLFWGTEGADTYVDISDSFDTKVEAVMAHKSQMRNRSLAEVRGFVSERARDAGSTASEPLQMAESFRKITFRV